MISSLKNVGTHFYRKVSPAFGEKISLHWHRSSNFGDVLSKYIVERLSGKKVETVDQNTPYQHYLAIGSILSLATDRSIVWGAGIANRNDTFLKRPRKISMVRGVYSRELCKTYGFKHEIQLGDPGYAISQIYNPPHRHKKYRLGVIPHWVDYKLARHFFSGDDDILVINLLTDDIEHVIGEILSCEKCISSSLHGIVVCHSYQIPCLHVTFTDAEAQTGLKEFQLGGDGIKYLDYFSSVGIAEYKPLELRGAKAIQEIILKISSDCGNHGQIKKIIDCCPFMER